MIEQKTSPSEGFDLSVLPYQDIGLITDPNVSGKELRQIAEDFSFYAVRQLQEMGCDFGQNVLVVGPPRGAFPFVGGAVCSLRGLDKKATAEFSNGGPHADLGKSVIHFSVPPDIDCLVVADGVVGSGMATWEHMRQVRDRLPAGWKGRFVSLSAAAADLGWSYIADTARHLPGVDLVLATGRLFPEKECVGWQTIGEKEVYFVGVGDMGERVQGNLEIQDLYAMFGAELPNGGNNV